MTQTNVYISLEQPDYALLDCGEGMKLERYGKVVLSRPDPQVLWKKRLPESEWAKADASFVKTDPHAAKPLRDSKEGKEKSASNSASGTGGAGSKSFEDRGVWVYKDQALEEGWNITYDKLGFKVRPTPFKHTGLFPEQINNWQWARELIEKEIKERVVANSENPEPIKVLNLFGYTGGASLSAALAGAHVTHVDASRAAITWARENAEVSGLTEKPIRWILEDAHAFVKREIRRENKYDAIIMDPPAFGRGAKGEVWRIEEDFLPFFDNVLKLLSDKPLFIILNGYSAGYSPITYENNLKDIQKTFGGTVECGELVVQEENRPGIDSRILPCGMVGRWKKA